MHFAMYRVELYMVWSHQTLESMKVISIDFKVKPRNIFRKRPKELAGDSVHLLAY